MGSTGLAASIIDQRDALQRATRTRHRAVAGIASMRRLFADDYTLEEYRLHIARLFGFFEPIECLIARAPASGIQERGFARTPALVLDLATMGYSMHGIRSLARCATLPEITPTNVYGCCYVLLGSLLGGRIIAQRLRNVFGTRASLRFYGDGNDEIDQRWASFCTELERQSSANLTAICDAANATFDAYAAWFCDQRTTDGHAVAG